MDILLNKPFKIADIIKTGNPGRGGSGSVVDNLNGTYIAYGGAGGGDAGLSYKNSGGNGGNPDKTYPDSGQNYGAGMSGIPYNGSSYTSQHKGGGPLFLIIYHNDNITNDI